MNRGVAVLIDEPVKTRYSRLPNEATAKAIREARAGIGVRYFSSASEMFEELDKDEED